MTQEDYVTKMLEISVYRDDTFYLRDKVYVKGFMNDYGIGVVVGSTSLGDSQTSVSIFFPVKETVVDMDPKNLSKIDAGTN